MSGPVIIGCRVPFQTPAADPGNGRMRGGWGTTPRIRFMRAQLYAARICDFCRSFKASGGLIFNALLQACKQSKRDVSENFEPVSCVLAHDEQHASEALKCPTKVLKRTTT